MVSLHVANSGALVTVQDCGRFGWEHMGIAHGGALDGLAYAWVNRLAGNPGGAAVLECVLQGMEVVPSDEVWMSTAGAGEVSVDGRRFPGWAGFWVSGGSRVTLRAVTGVRAYLAVSGGIDVEPVLGSRSTNLEGGFGGLDGRALRRGDELPVGWFEHRSYPRDELWRNPSPVVLPRPLTVRAVAGPAEAGPCRPVLDRLVHTLFTVAPQSNHMGLRLLPDALDIDLGDGGISQPMAVGAIQITPSGAPLVLLSGRGTIGGYPVAAVVASADHWALGQLRPGDGVRFALVTRESAISAARVEAQRREQIVPHRVRLHRGRMA